MLDKEVLGHLGKVIQEHIDPFLFCVLIELQRLHNGYKRKLAALWSMQINCYIRIMSYHEIYWDWVSS